MTKMLLRFLPAIALATVTFAQPSGTPPTPAEMAQHRVEMLTNRLTLTSTQQQQALTIFTNAITAEQALRTNMQTARTALNDAVKKNDTAGIDQAANTIGTLTAQSISINSKADAAFYAILTPDQQAKLGTGFGGGFGPHGGPGGGFGPMGGGPGGRFRRGQ